MPKHEISLNARWAMMWFDEGRGEALGAYLRDFDDSAWLDGHAPGDAHLDLMRAGKIADPFFGLNHLDCKWMEEKEWWYRRDFFPGEEFRGHRVALSFQGLDTFATVWVNGRRAGAHRNMFIPCTFDVTDLIRIGHRNTVAVCFSSPIKAVEGKSLDGLSAVFETHERLHARKAQMSYGWDIAPRILTCGIWRPAYLIAKGDVSIGDVAVRTTVESEEKATVRLEIPLTANSPGFRKVRVCIEIRNGKTVIDRQADIELVRGQGLLTLDVPVDNPRLWWPWNVGRPDLYHLAVKAVVNGSIEDECRTKFGIRSVELVQEPQSDGGTSFMFAINGRKVYAKGTNWIPGDAIFARMTRRKYRELIDLALDNNCNMLRIWGGGIYEDPYFYRLCDERGIMVWQDFMFTCADYPEDEEFLSEVRREAERVVADLRNHPSIVLWCGDNEVDAGRTWRGIASMENAINRGVLPEVCARLDPTRPYIQSSPFSPSGDPDANSRTEGDCHNWHHGTSYRDEVYAKDSCRFVSEIGHLSIPWPESVRRFIPEPDLWPPENRAWDFHFGTVERVETHRRERLNEAIAAFGFERPNNLEGYAALTQLIQALAYKEWMEHYRRRKPLCGGSLYWNLYDNWPQFSDAAVDYYQNPKIAYYYVGRAFSNLLVSLEEMGQGMIGVWLINDELRPRIGKLLLRCQRLDGGMAWTRILPARLPADSSRMVWEMRLPAPLMEEPHACFAQARLLLGGRTVSESFYFPAEFKDIEWPETWITARISSFSRNAGGTQADIVISSALYGRLVRIETPDHRARISDNFFDIPPGEERTVRVIFAKGHNGPFPVRVSSANCIQAVDLIAP